MTEIFETIAASLAEVLPEEMRMKLREDVPVPPAAELRKLMLLLRETFFPGASRQAPDVPAIYSRLARYVPEKSAIEFLKGLPEIKRLLLTDVAAVAHNDPAVRDFAEVVHCYPAIDVMIHYRVAHKLYELGVRTIPRMITEIAHSATGIDIHPAAQIGEYFGIDHGTGVVIGETTIIGNHVMLYQGVTLGAKNFRYDSGGLPIAEPRHPVLEDNITVYSNTSILGRVHIGHDTVIGGNVWLTHDVPPYSKILQGKAILEK